MKIASIGQGGPEIEQYLSGWAAKRGLIFQMERAVPGGRYDMVLAGPTEGETVPFCQTEVLIAYGKEAGALAQRIQARTVVTYGTNQSTLSLSSAGDSCMVALQREVTDLAGGAWQIGEVCLPGGLPGHLACAAAGALLTCGWGGALMESE